MCLWVWGMRACVCLIAARAGAGVCAVAWVCGTMLRVDGYVGVMRV